MCCDAGVSSCFLRRKRGLYAMLLKSVSEGLGPAKVLHVASVAYEYAIIRGNDL